MEVLELRFKRYVGRNEDGNSAKLESRLMDSVEEFKGIKGQMCKRTEESCRNGSRVICGRIKWREVIGV